MMGNPPCHSSDSIEAKADDRKRKEMEGSILLVLTAAIWGFAFVAQRVGNQYVGPFTFTGIRFALGAVSLLPLIWISGRKKKKCDALKATTGIMPADRENAGGCLFIGKAGALTGSVLFFGAALQQVGLEDTTAGKAAFLTGFYIILVPLSGVFLKQKIGRRAWISAVFAIIGLYLISVNENTGISRGDLLEFLGAFFWSAHILLISRFTQKTDTLKLSFVQYLVCSALSMAVALLTEDIRFQGIAEAGFPILFGGIGSVGIAYTLQAYGQKYAKPSHAAIIMSLESVFAALGGFLFLHETMNIRSWAGCILMLAGVIISQTGNKPYDKYYRADVDTQ